MARYVDKEQAGKPEMERLDIFGTVTARDSPRLAEPVFCMDCMDVWMEPSQAEPNNIVAKKRRTYYECSEYSTTQEPRVFHARFDPIADSGFARDASPLRHNVVFRRNSPHGEHGGGGLPGA